MKLIFIIGLITLAVFVAVTFAWLIVNHVFNQLAETTAITTQNDTKDLLGDVTDNLTAALIRINELESRPTPTVTITTEKVIENIITHDKTVVIPQPFSFTFGEAITPKPFHTDYFDCDDSSIYDLLYFTFLDDTTYTITPWTGISNYSARYGTVKHAWIEVTSNNVTLAYDFGIPFPPEELHQRYPNYCQPITIRQLFEYVLMDFNIF